jgi:serine/threonine-protein kinase
MKVIKNRYRLDNLIGQGGMAVVYQGTDLVLNRTVAIKILHSHLTEDKSFVERFKREAQDLARLIHPNIVAVYDAGIENDSYFIVMEYVEGKTLKELIEETALPLAHAVKIIYQVAKALEHAHKHGLIHRDIKPQNIIVMPDHQVKVTDFGIARAVGRSGLTRTGKILGTAQYISPEQASGRTADERSDIYSVGILFYEMLTGKPPFDGPIAVEVASKHIKEEPVPPGKLNPATPKQLENLILKMLAKKPEDRYQSFSPIIFELEAWLNKVDQIKLKTSLPLKSFLLKGLKATGVILALILAASLIGLTLKYWPSYLTYPLANQVENLRRSSSKTKTLLQIKPVAAQDYDPLGSQAENSSKVRFAYDNNPYTAWNTEGYNNQYFGNLKEGVGLYFDFGKPLLIKRVRIISTKPGWAGVIKGSNDAADWWEIKKIKEAPIDLQLELLSPKFRYYLIWITKLTGPTRGRYRVGLAEVYFWQEQK